MSLYLKYRRTGETQKGNPNNSKTVIFRLISCMSDNKSFLKIEDKGDSGDSGPKITYYNSHVSLSLNNLNISDVDITVKDDLIFLYSQRDIQGIVEMLNSGTSVVSQIIFR